VSAVLRLKGSTNLDSIHIIKKPGGTMKVGVLGGCYVCFPLGCVLSRFLRGRSVAALVSCPPPILGWLGRMPRARMWPHTLASNWLPASQPGMLAPATAINLAPGTGTLRRHISCGELSMDTRSCMCCSTLSSPPTPPTPHTTHHTTPHHTPHPTLQDSFLDEGFILNKQIGVGQPKRIENARVLVANTPMDTDKVKIYGARVRTDGLQKVSA
jgi:hypothetical protein